jgi:hypothetical protein
MPSVWVRFPQKPRMKIYKLNNFRVSVSVAHDVTRRFKVVFWYRKDDKGMRIFIESDDFLDAAWRAIEITNDSSVNNWTEQEKEWIDLHAQQLYDEAVNSIISPRRFL